MNDCEQNCSTSHSAESESKKVVLTRRGLLTALGAGLTAIGLTSLGETAAYAAKTYTVCKTTDIKVGSGKVFRPAGASAYVLITQPRKGVWRAFNANCTHENVPVAGAANNIVVCNQHGAQFNADTGARTAGPARRALTKFKVAVSGTSVKVTF